MGILATAMTLPILSTLSTCLLAVVPPLLVLYIAGRRKFSARPGEPPFVSYVVPWFGNIFASVFYYETFMAQQA